MIQIIKKKIIMKEELLSKIKWACMMSKVTPKIYEGNLRIIDRTNLAYVEPHRVIIKEKIYLFFNDVDYFYIDDLREKHSLSKLSEYISSN